MVVEVFVGFIRKQSDMSEYSGGTRDYIYIYNYNQHLHCTLAIDSISGIRIDKLREDNFHTWRVRT